MVNNQVNISSVIICCANADSVEDGEKVIQTALDAFGRIGAYCTVFV